MLHSAFAISAEPTRQELWVPTNELDTILKAHPNAVMLSPEQYATLIRDAGKTKPEDDPRLAPLPIIAIQGLRLDGKLEPGAASVTLHGELTLQLPSKEWASAKFPWPFAMSSLTSEGTVLASMEPPKQGEPEMFLFAKGPGAAKLKFETVVPVSQTAGVHTLAPPDVPFSGVLNLTLPAGMRLLAGSAYERSGDIVKVAFDHRPDDNDPRIELHRPRAFCLRWSEAASGAASQPLRYAAAARAEVQVTESNVATTLYFKAQVQHSTDREVELEWKLTGKDTQVTDVSGPALLRWRQEGAKLFVTLERDGGMHELRVSLRRIITSIADAGELPLLALNPPLLTQVKLGLAPDLDFLDLSGAKQLERDTFEFQLGVDQPRLVLRTSKPRIESDVDVIARIDKDSVQIERKLVLRSDRPVTEVKVTLPPAEEFIAVLSTPIGSNQVMSVSNGVAMIDTPRQTERIITPNNISQPVFSQRATTSNVGTAPPASPFPLTWRRVGQTIAILPLTPIDPAHPLELSITSRLKLTKAWTGPKNPETLTLHQLDVPDAVKVAGYTALDFDDAWRVALKEAKGLEDRDARLAPVKGRMAWFGLREHALTFEVERAEAVFSTEVTAYALPRARTVEIEGQFMLDISGAPLRSFQVKLPVATAKLLRVTSPLVGEQQLDEATGIWTYTLRQESKGRHTIRWRMSLPSDAGDANSTVPANQTLTATLPHLELPQSRRFSGTWVIEANTDTQLSTKMQNMQPLDVLRVPVVADYQPRHRITSAFTYGAGDSALTITAQRHAHSELAALVVNRVNLLSVLGTDGHSMHEATLDLSHSGEQFVSLHLPKDAELLSTSSGGQAVKPVRSVEDAIAIPLPAGSANQPHTLVRVQYRLQSPPWSRSGTQDLEPIRIVGNVPVLSTEWQVFAPSTFGYGKVDTTLEQSHLTEDADDLGFLPRLALLLGKPLGVRYYHGTMSKNVDFLPGGLSGMANREIGSRVGEIEDARTAMDRGDELFKQGHYEAALGPYKAAIDSVPDAPKTKDWLNLAKLKFADCSVVVARERAKQGQMLQARQALEAAVLLMPEHKSAQSMLQKLSPQMDDYGEGRSPGARLTEKMNRIIFPAVSFQGATIEEAIEYLNVKSRELDTFPDSAGNKGVPLILKAGGTPSTARITLDLKDIPMIEVLRYVTELANMKYKVEAQGVLIVPITEYASEQVTRTYHVPPDFLARVNSAMPAAEATAETADPFAPAKPPPAQRGAITRSNIKQGLESMGVVFPDGATASYNPASSQLVVRNTQPNLDLVEVLVQNLAHPPPPPPAESINSITFDYGIGRSPGAYLTEKMNKIILPSVQFQGATLEEALEYLRVKARDLDTFTDSSGTNGVNFILRNGDAPSNASISLDLKDVPLSEALRYVTELAQMKYKVEAHAVLVVPLSENASEQYTRAFRVPQNFLDASGRRYKTARQILEGAGITFPEGASAIYSAGSLTTLVVRNTQPNLDLVEAYIESLSKSPYPLVGRLFASVDEMRFDASQAGIKSGLIPLDVVLPQNGRLLRFHGAQPPETLALHYISWSQQMVRAVLAMALGLALFWRLGRRRPWFLSLLVLILIAWAAPLLLEGSLLALANALAFGWLCALALHLLGRLFTLSLPQTASLRSFVIRHSGFVIAFFLLLTPSLDAQPPPPDPAAHTVIIPYDIKQPLSTQKAERFYLGYDEFQRLWKLAKENRRPLPAETDTTQQAVIHSALYQGRIEERSLVLDVRITATTRGEWTRLVLNIGQMLVGSYGEVRVDGKSAASDRGSLTIEHPGTHVIELTVTLPLPRDWSDLTITLPRALSGMLAITTPKSDGWLQINDAPAATVEEQPAGRLFTQTLGAHDELRLQRSPRGLERGEGPVPSATVHGTLTLRELGPETLDAEIQYEFPGAVRRTFEFAIDEHGLEIGTFNISSTTPRGGKVLMPAMTTQTKREGGKILYTITLRHEVSHSATLHIEGAQRFLSAPGTRTMPLIQPLAQRVKQDIALLHDDSIKLKVTAAAAQRSTNTNNNGLQDAGRWQWTGNAAAPTYDVQPAALFAEADVSYVFQLSEQKAELLAALTLKRKRGVWTRAVVGLPADYEVQAVQGPALTAWQHEGSRLYLQLDPATAGVEARLVVHLAKVAPQPVTAWKLEPLKLENYEKIGGKALIVAHAANDVRLPDLAQRGDLRELDASVLDSVFAIAPPMEKKRALQHEGTAWTVDVALTRQASRFSAETMLLVLASDAGIRVSQQVVALVEQGAVRQVSVRLPAALPEAVVSGPLLRETRSRIDGAERVYECSLQTEVLDRAELTFDLDLPLTAELEVPFVQVADASRLSRWFVLDNASAREAKITTQQALEEVARETVPYLPAGLSRPKFFRATGEGALKLAYQQLTSTEGNAALITLADLTTVLRPDGTRWDIAQYSLINRSLQFLPVVLPDHAELISVSVSGEPVRADEETQNGRRVRLIPLIHTRPGQRALEVKMIYRFTQSGKLQQAAKLDDPEVLGLSVERTTWTVWTPQGWNLKDFDGNMTATAAEGRELLQLEGMLSELGEANRALSSGKLDYGEAAAAYRDANALAEMVQQKKRELLSRASRGSLMLSSDSKMDTEVRQQQELLQGNWNSNYAGKQAVTKIGKETPIQKGQTSWGMNDAAPQEQQLRLSANNTFSGSVAVNGGQLFNDNLAVDNSYFANGASLGGTITAGNRAGGFTINNNSSIDNLLTASQTSQNLTQNATGSFNTVNSNARSNNLGNNGQVVMPQAGSRSAPVADVPVKGALFNGKDMQSLPGGGAGLTLNNTNSGASSHIAGAGAITLQPQALNEQLAIPAPAPAMGFDPFGAAAMSVADPFAAPAVPAAIPMKAEAPRKADADGREQDRTLTLAQTVESLRPTGRRALGIDLPLNGTAHHFSKLKDHAVLEVQIQRQGDPKTTARLLCLTGGLLLWGAIGWKLKRRNSVR